MRFTLTWHWSYAGCLSGSCQYADQRPFARGRRNADRCGVVEVPPSAWAFEALLDKVAMGARDLPRADGQALAQGFVVKLFEPLAEALDDLGDLSAR